MTPAKPAAAKPAPQVDGPCGEQNLIDRAIDEADLLVYFASSRGIEVPEETAKAIVAFRETPETDLGAELAFWKAYSKLAALVRPATILSIRAATSHGEDGKEKSTADQAVRRYRRYAIITILLVVAVQAYWVYGVQIFDTLKESERAKEQTRLAIAGRQADLEKTKEEGVEPFDKTLQQLKAKEMNEAQAVEASNAELRKWATLATKFLPSEYTARSANVGSAESVKTEEITSEIRDKYRIQAFAKFILETLQRYLLPLLYGLLGSAVYILRTLAGEVQRVSFESDTGYKLRLPLGALAGAALAWFFGEAFSGATGIKSLSSFALAFLGGYSVEVLFSGMDRLVEAFGGATASSPRKASPE